MERFDPLAKRFEIERQLIEKILKDDKFKKELIDNPVGILKKEFDIEIPPQYKITVLEENQNEMIIVLPHDRLSTNIELDENDLDSIAGGWTGMVECGAVPPNKITD